MSNHHDGVRCDACDHAGFGLTRFKCLICDDFDLCSSCFARKCEVFQHRSSHPMQCILLRSDFPDFYPGSLKNEFFSFTCPYCGLIGLDKEAFASHVHKEHSNPFLEKVNEVLCPLCFRPNIYTVSNARHRSLATHLTEAHKLGKKSEGNKSSHKTKASILHEDLSAESLNWLYKGMANSQDFHQGKNNENIPGVGRMPHERVLKDKLKKKKKSQHSEHHGGGAAKGSETENASSIARVKFMTRMNEQFAAGVMLSSSSDDEVPSNDLGQSDLEVSSLKREEVASNDSFSQQPCQQQSKKQYQTSVTVPVNENTKAAAKYQLQDYHSGGSSCSVDLGKDPHGKAFRKLLEHDVSSNLNNLTESTKKSILKNMIPYGRNKPAPTAGIAAAEASSKLAAPNSIKSEIKINTSFNNQERPSNYQGGNAQRHEPTSVTAKMSTHLRFRVPSSLDSSNKNYSLQQGTDEANSVMWNELVQMIIGQSLTDVKISDDSSSTSE